MRALVIRTLLPLARLFKEVENTVVATSVAKSDVELARVLLLVARVTAAAPLNGLISFAFCAWFAKLKPDSCVTSMDPNGERSAYFLSPVYHFNLIICGFHAVTYRTSCIRLFHFGFPFSRVCSRLSFHQRAQNCDDYAFCFPFSSPPSQRFSHIGIADAASRRQDASSASHCCVQAVRLHCF
jgi:hypothetical protein